MKISVIGCGYLGAVHAASMAELGHDVVGIDVDREKVDLLSQGKAPFFEPDLDDLLRSGSRPTSPTPGVRRCTSWPWARRSARGRTRRT